VCQKCANPESPEGKAVRSYFQSRGKNFTDEEIAKKTKHLLSLNDSFIVGNPHFTPELDTMPDGVHAKTRFKWKKVYTNLETLKHYNTKKGQNHCEKLKAEYDAIPEPKPEYLEWASERSRPQLFEELYRQAVSAKQGIARIKAISTILEFTKSKPKQELEVSRADFSGELPDLFRQLAQLGGIPSEAVEALITSYLEKPNTAN
jgi:hypothetical protein